jgi:multidrug efflux pump subunit AcrA (membrane-fusion protein)
MNRSFFKAGALAALCLLAGVGCAKKNAGVRLGTVAKGSVMQRVTVTGYLSPARRTLISAPYEGYLHKIAVKVGQRVKAEEPVFSIRPSRPMVGEEFFSIRAPIAGTVVQILKSEGELVRQNDPGFVRIDDLSRLQLEADVPEVDVSKLEEGQEGVIRATAVPDRTYKGVIKRISRAAVERTTWDRARVEFSIVLDIVDKDDRLQPGMSAMVDVIAKKVENVLTLRLEYLEKTDDGIFVTLENGERREVKTGMQNEEAAEIVSGLKEGDRVRQVDYLALGKRDG